MADHSLLQQCIEPLAGGIAIVDRELRCIAANTAMRERLGAPADQLIGRRLDAFSSPGPDLVRTLHERALGAEASACQDDARPSADGSLWRAEPWRSGDGGIAGTIFRCEPPGDRGGEQRLRQATRSEALGELSGGIAHDFNNLLMVISGNLNLIVRREKYDETDKASLEAALRAVARATDMTRRLLAFSRRMPLHPKIVDLNDPIRESAERFAAAPGPAITIKLDLAAGPAWAFVDPGEFQSAFANLLLNAREAMPDGGQISIRTRRSEAGAGDASAPDGWLTLSVGDSGVGMPPDMRARAFEPFFTTKPKGKGNGLGLSVVYGFTEQSGGRAEIHSTPGIGTTVDLHLPAARSSSAAGERRNLPAAAAPAAKVLLVEDDDDVRLVIQDQLQYLGYAVRTAATGDEALPILRADKDIAILLTDVVLPGRTGGAALATDARASRPDITVVCMSGYSHDIARDQIESLGVPLLSKPFSDDDLRAAIRTAATDQAGGPAAGAPALH